MTASINVDAPSSAEHDALAARVLALESAEPPSGGSQGQMDWSEERILFCHPGTALWGPVSAAAWAFPGAALSANVFAFHPSRYTGWELISAVWRVEWTPGHATSQSGVGLFWMDSGPTNLYPLLTCIEAGTGPRSSGGDVTSSFQYLLDYDLAKMIGHQAYGNGATGAAIYRSAIDMHWRRA